MIDVSDGLALDLHRLADASGVGFRLDDVPVADGATLDEALGGGEDYELVLVADGEVSDDPVRRASWPPGCAARSGSARWSATRRCGCSGATTSAAWAGSTGSG